MNGTSAFDGANRSETAFGFHAFERGLHFRVVAKYFGNEPVLNEGIDRKSDEDVIDTADIRCHRGIGAQFADDAISLVHGQFRRMMAYVLALGKNCVVIPTLGMAIDRIDESVVGFFSEAIVGGMNGGKDVGGHALGPHSSTMANCVVLCGEQSRIGRFIGYGHGMGEPMTDLIFRQVKAVPRIRP